MTNDKLIQDFIKKAMYYFFVMSANTEVPGVHRNQQIGFPTRTQENEARMAFMKAAADAKDICEKFRIGVIN